MGKSIDLDISPARPPARLEMASPGLEMAQENLELVTRHLASRAEAIFVREPLIDPQTPATSDLDLMAFGPVDQLLTERLIMATDLDQPVMVDLIWLPSASLAVPEKFARQGYLPHRLLSSRPSYDSNGSASRHWEAVSRCFYDPGIQGERIAVLLDLGYDAVREIGITWDFPPLALFWLHIAQVACMASLCDGLKILCPNIFTRPMGWIRQAEQQANLSLEVPFSQALHLETNPLVLIPPLKRIHETVSHRFPEPDWPAGVKPSIRYEYRYFLSSTELNWRIKVARELADRGDPAAATYYLRFWAYALARVPMVHHLAREGRNISFLRPERAVRPALQACCPEIIDDLTEILGGPITEEEVKHSLEKLLRFRQQTLDFLKERNIHVPMVRDWRPFQPPAAP